MIGSSRTSLALLGEDLKAKFGDPGLAVAGGELLEVADLLTREKQLSSTLSDAGQSAQERKHIMADLLSDRVSALTLEVSETIVGLRWSSESDLVDALEYAGAEALYGAAEADGELDRVEDELFRFNQILASDGELQLALSSPGLPPATKNQILSDLLTDKVAKPTLTLLSYISGHLRGRRIEQTVGRFTELAADRRGKLLAVVQSARPLTQDQTDRLARALAGKYDREVAINAEVNPALVGGVSVQIGDDVIDGSIANRLDQVRRRVTG
ncbi:F0F1 ATP synthase subunit delta [Candidatus Nanopelagicales bacterium]|nr:F0F1 ATP synthase subunit delta [Candidatus Nanopelagicales bacterium]